MLRLYVKILSILSLLICSGIYPLFAQEKDTLSSTHTLDEVVVCADRLQRETIPVQVLSGETLKKLSVHSVADAVRYFSGVQVKDYGGIGGLKTVNIRSMGSHHVGVFYDGIELGNAQNGVVDLGRFLLDNMEAVTLHTIKNVEGKRDFRVLANAFYANANPDPNAPVGGSCEPGVIMVAYDANKDGVPNDNEWYEIAASSHVDPTKETFYQKIKDAGFDVNLYRDYEITYHKPAKEPASKDEWSTYISWEDNQGQKDYKVKNQFHKQCYYPLWTKGDKLTFKGTCLPQNAMNESGTGTYFVLYKFLYGYADNEINSADDSAIDISWAVNNKGQYVELPGVDFIKIYTGVNQENGWLGECSTEITGVEDLHILGVDIDTRK